MESDIKMKHVLAISWLDQNWFCSATQTLSNCRNSKST